MVVIFTAVPCVLTLSSFFLFQPMHYSSRMRPQDQTILITQ